jgi:hypothetical protein
MLNNFFKPTLRSLRKNRGYSFLNIFGLAAGAIFISCLVFFGLSAYTAERRTKEIKHH